MRSLMMELANDRLLESGIMELADVEVRPWSPMADDWTERCWEAPLAAADRLTPQLRGISCAALRSVFPPSLVDTLRAARHPIVAHQFTVAGRLGLLELGLAVASLPAADDDIHRLRDPGEFEGAAAELRGGLMLQIAGGRLQRPPHIPERQRCEYIAEFPGGHRLALEVKCPNQGDEERDVERVSSDFFMEFMHRFRWLSPALPPGRATIHLAPSLLDLQLGDRTAVDSLRVRQVVEDAAERIMEALRTGFTPTISLGSIGTLEIRPDPLMNGVFLDARGPDVSARDLALRVRRLLNKAVRQIYEAHLPGLIILDLQRDHLARNAIGFWAQWAQRKQSVAAVLVISRSCSATDGRMYGEVDVLPGPRLSAVEKVLSDVLTVCADGHLHYNPLSTPSTPCPCTWLRRLQA